MRWWCLRWWRWTRDIPREVRWFIQRGRRGWSDADNFSLFSYLDRIIAGAVGQMADDTYSYPSSITVEEWEEILRAIADGFQAHIESDDEWPKPGSERERELQQRFNKGMELFVKWYEHLWT